MIAKQATRNLYESCGRGFANRIRHLLGVADKDGNAYLDHAGNQIFKAPTTDTGKPEDRLRVTEFSIKDLAESIVGPDWARKLTMGPAAMHEPGTLSNIQEAGTNMVTASAFADINAFTAVVSGLLEISVMEAFKNPKYIADELMPPENTRMFAGRKVIGTTRLGDVAEVRTPGMPTKRVGFGERWILQPQTVENALSCEVTQEAVYLDLTGEVLEQANSVGDWLAWRKEIRVIDAFIGVNNTYSYKGTSYNTYISNGYFNNDISTNELVDWTNIETCLLVFREMQDPETSTRVSIQPNTILVNQEKLFTARAIFGATELEQRMASGGTGSITGGSGSFGASTNFNPTGVRRFANVLENWKILTSPLVYQECINPAGLNLSAANAGKYYWVFEQGKPFKYAQNWPLRVQQAAPNQLDMIDRGIVLFVKADERGVPMVYEPRRIVRSHA